jgi:glycosyltransferase involved in cell wall biosynthesis
VLYHLQATDPSIPNDCSNGDKLLSNRFLLAIPVYNEADYVLSVLARSSEYATDIVIIDDGSTDSTPKLLSEQRFAEVVRHAENRGYGASLATAFSIARERGFEWLITMDCDDQHEPRTIPSFVRTFEASDWDIVSGSRYVSALDGNDQPPMERRVINARVTSMLNDRLGLGITDAFCGFKAYRVSAMDCIRITVPGYAMPMQFWVQAWRAGLRICEIPVRLIYNDPTRHFGGILDDPEARLTHYLDVFETEMSRPCPTSVPTGCRRTSVA